jgi:hypothetical protein
MQESQSIHRKPLLALKLTYRNGDIYQLSPIIATLYAIISKIQTYSFKQYENPFEALFRKDEEE